MNVGKRCDIDRSSYRYRSLDACEELERFAAPKKLSFKPVGHCSLQADPTWHKIDLWKNELTTDEPRYLVSDFDSAALNSASQIHYHNAMELPRGKEILCHVNKDPITKKKPREHKVSKQKFKPNESRQSCARQTCAVKDNEMPNSTCENRNSSDQKHLKFSKAIKSSNVYENLAFFALGREVCDPSTSSFIRPDLTQNNLFLMDSFSHCKAATEERNRKDNAVCCENEAFRRRTCGSVSSDPEVYTKTDTGFDKIDVQFKKLKEEFLALRSTTAEFQQLMDKVLQDLVRIRFAREQKNLWWMKDSYTGTKPTSVEIDRNSESSNLPFINGRSEKQCDVISDENSKFIPLSNRVPSAQLSSSNYENVSHLLPPSACAKSNQTPAFHCLCSENPLVHNQQKMNYATKSTVAPQMSWDFAGENDADLPKHREKTAKDQLSLPVFKDATTKLHVSECSIDSGYQDANVLSPPEKQIRLSSNLLNHPSDNESEKSSTSHETIPKQLVRSSFTGTIPNLYVVHASPNRTARVNAKNTVALTTTAPTLYTTLPAVNNEVRSERWLDNLHELSCERFSNFPTQSMNCKANEQNFETNHSNVDERNIASCEAERPIPKQRILFPKETALNYVERARKKFHRNERLKRLASGSQVEDLIQDRGKHDGFNLKPTSLNATAELQFRYSLPSNISSQPSQHFNSLEDHSANVLRLATPSASNPECSKDVKLRKHTFEEAKNFVQEKHVVSQKEVIVEDKKSDHVLIRRRSMRLMQELHTFNFENLEQNRSISVESVDADCTEHSASEKSARLDLLDTKPEQNASLKSVQPSYAVSLPFARACRDDFKKNTFSIKSSTNETFTPVLNATDSKPCTYSQQQYVNVRLSSGSSPTSLDVVQDFAFTDVTNISATENFGSATTCRKSPTKFAVFVPPLIRPKASLPGTKRSQTEPRGKTCNSLKLHPNSKSAFRPVTPSNSFDSPRYSHLNMTSNTSENDNRCFPTSVKRRVTLPSGSVSNKQRYLNEFDLSSSFDESKSEKHLPSVFREFSIHSCPNDDVVESVISTETARVTSYGRSDTPQNFVPVFHGASESFSSEAEKSINNGSIHHCNSTNRDLSLRSAFNSKKKNSKLNCSEKVDFRRVKTHKSAESSQNEKKVFPSWNPPLQKQRGVMHCSASLHRDDKKKKEAPKSSSHVYETVKLPNNSNKKDFEISRRKKENYVNLQSLPNHDANSKNHSKSTVALIKASLFGKLGKSNRASHQQVKDTDEDFTGKLELVSDTQTPSKAKHSSKDKKLKKNVEQKSQKRSLIRRFSKEKFRRTASPTQNNFSPSQLVSVPPGETRYGHADAEVMERFLEATVHFQSHPPQSPLQRLRNSLRMPRSKHRHLHENRIKDDLEIRGMERSRNFEHFQRTKFQNEQECTTYV